MDSPLYFKVVPKASLVKEVFARTLYIVNEKDKGMINEAKKAPSPITQKTQDITSVEPLLPIARQIVKRQGLFTLGGLDLKPD